MIMGMMAAQMRAAAGAPGALWTPLNMATVPQIYLDAQDSVVTNVSGACSAISNLGAMGSAGDFSQATAGSRPTILAAELNGKRVLRFDGVDDHLLGGSAAQKDLMRNKGAGWAFHVVKKRLLDAGGALNRLVFFCEEGASGSRFTIFTGINSDNVPTFQGKRLDGSSIGSVLAPASSGVYAMRMMSATYSSGRGEIFIDGTLAASNPSMTSAGNTSNTASSRDLSIGAIAGALLPADIDLAAIIVSNTPPSSGDIDKLMGWAAHKYGLTANLPGAHPYKMTAPTV
jgi:hypothetical protein